MSLFSGGVRVMRIFPEVTRVEGVKRQWGCRKRQFSAFSMAIFSDTLEMSQCKREPWELYFWTWITMAHCSLLILIHWKTAEKYLPADFSSAAFCQSHRAYTIYCWKDVLQTTASTKRERENVYFVTKPNNTYNISNSNKFCDRTPEKANCPSMSGDPNEKNKKVTIMHNIKKGKKLAYEH